MTRKTNDPPPASHLPDQFITVAEAAVRLRVSRSTVYEAIRTGHLKAWRFGHRWLLTEEGIGHALAQDIPAAWRSKESD